MRTDVKVGLISLFIIVLGVVGYFTWQSQRGDTKSSDIQPIGQTGLVNNDTPGLRSTQVPPPPPAANPTRESLSGSAVVIMPPETGPAATTQSLNVAISARDAFPPLHPSVATAPGTTYPATFGNAGGVAGNVSVEPAGGKKAIDFGVAPNSDVTGNGPSVTPSAAGGYVVKKGDTFAKIAKSLKTTVKALEAANPGVSSNSLKIGQTLNVPADAGTSAEAPKPAPSVSGSSSAASDSGSAARSSESKAGSGRPTTYVVKKGDTLSKIAKKYYGSEKAWQRIVRANRDSLNRDGSNLSIGMELRLPE